MLKDFRIEYQKNPIGLDVNPRFSWKLHSEQPNTMQDAYRIIVTEKESQVWDSGHVESSQSSLIEYKGQSLKPMTEYHVMVNVRDNHGELDEISGTFETGLLKQKNWKAKWITHELPEDETACPVFIREVQLEGKKIKSARIFATACGVYDIQINDKKVGDTFFAPGWTSYQNRLQYQTYDVTKMLQDNNEIKITVGNGWFKGYLNGEGESCFYGNQVAILAMIRLEFKDGTSKIIGTDTDWLVTTGIIRSAELYHGEVQDFTFQVNKESVIQSAVEFHVSDKISHIIAQESEPVRVTKRFPAVKKIVTPKGELVLDFGQNMAGLVEVKLPKLNGDKLVIRHAETLDKEGNFYMTNLRTAKCTDTYIYGKNEEDKIVMPHFTYHGFRYICIEGVDENVDMNRFTACAMHTDMEQTGTFTCDNERINQLQSNIEWGQRSNYFDVPTDCPQRDERLGWSGDAQIFAATAGYNFNTSRFFKKWLHDVAVETSEENGVPHMIPNIVGKSVGTAVWSDCATVIPWDMYQIYGDVKILEEQYDSMKCHVEYIRRNSGEDVLWMNGFQRGDWLALDGDASRNVMSGGTDKNLVANVYYAYSTRILRDSAKILGKEHDASKYDQLYEKIVEELHNEYVTKNGRLVTETQTACVLLLHFNLIKEEYRARVVKTLEENLMLHKNHLTTGFVGTAYLCHALTENGKHNLAEEVFLQEDFPSWFYAIKMGATTIWERWNSILPNGDFDESGMNSLNHYTYGSIGDWMYKKIAGINPLEPGYKKILLKPVLTHSITKLKASLETIYGTIDSAWSCKNGIIKVDVTIPANTTAVLILPEKEEQLELGSGNYHYEYETNTSLEIKKYNMSTTFGELLADEHGKQVIDELMPGTTDGPMIGFISGKTLNEMIHMAPQMATSIEAILKRLNQ